jgi:hypothetical protein
LLAGALVGIATGGILSNSRACGGQARALHDGMVTRTLGHGGEPTGRRRREDMAAVSFTAAKSLAPLAVISGALLLDGRLREQAFLCR